MRYRHVHIIENLFEKISPALAPVRVRVGHQNVTWRWSFAIAEIQIVQGFELAQSPSVRLPRLNDFLQELDLFLHLQGRDQIKGLVFCDDVQIKEPHYFDQVHVCLRIQILLQMLENELFVFDWGYRRKGDGLLGFLFWNTFFLVVLFWRLFLHGFLVLLFGNFFIILVDHLVGRPVDFQVLKIEPSNKLLACQL